MEFDPSYFGDITMSIFNSRIIAEYEISINTNDELLKIHVYDYQGLGKVKSMDSNIF